MALAALCVAAPVCATTGTAAAADKLTDAVLLIPGFDIPLFDTPERSRKPVRILPFSEFPAQVWHVETITSAGRMHHIRLEQDGRDFWVKGTQVMLPAIEGNIQIACEADQAAIQGYTGRGIGGRTSCIEK